MPLPTSSEITSRETTSHKSVAIISSLQRFQEANDVGRAAQGGRILSRRILKSCKSRGRFCGKILSCKSRSLTDKNRTRPERNTVHVTCRSAGRGVAPRPTPRRACTRVAPGPAPRPARGRVARVGVLGVYLSYVYNSTRECPLKFYPCFALGAGPGRFPYVIRSVPFRGFSPPSYIY